MHCKANNPKACCRKMTHWQGRKATPYSSHEGKKKQLAHVSGPTERAKQVAPAYGSGEVSLSSMAVARATVTYSEAREAEPPRWRLRRACGRYGGPRNLGRRVKPCLPGPGSGPGRTTGVRTWS